MNCITCISGIILKKVYCSQRKKIQTSGCKQLRHIILICNQLNYCAICADIKNCNNIKSFRTIMQYHGSTKYEEISNLASSECGPLLNHRCTVKIHLMTLFCHLKKRGSWTNSTTPFTLPRGHLFI